MPVSGASETYAPTADPWLGRPLLLRLLSLLSRVGRSFPRLPGLLAGGRRGIAGRLTGSRGRSGGRISGCGGSLLRSRFRVVCRH